MEDALKINQLTKVYNNKLTALNQLNLEVKPGDFFALLGSNGAGKTTTISIITGLLRKTSGTICAFGINQNDNPSALKHLIGVMPQEFNFNTFEPVVEILINQAGYYGIHSTIAKKRAEKLLKRMQLWDKRCDIAKSLSGGMKRRLMLARALMHQPKILILDEPSAGVDVEIRLEMWQFLKELNKNGTTIILTTHYLEEAKNLCRNIAIIDKGQVIIQSSMAELLNQAKYQSFILESEKPLPSTIKLTIDYNKINNKTIKIQLDKSQNISDIVLELSTQNIKINRIDSGENRLENLFLSLTKK